MYTELKYDRGWCYLVVGVWIWLWVVHLIKITRVVGFCVKVVVRIVRVTKTRTSQFYYTLFPLYNRHITCWYIKNISQTSKPPAKRHTGSYLGLDFLFWNEKSKFLQSAFRKIIPDPPFKYLRKCNSNQITQVFPTTFNYFFIFIRKTVKKSS